MRGMTGRLAPSIFSAMKRTPAATRWLALGALVAISALAGCGDSDDAPAQPHKPPLLEEPPVVCKGANLAALTSLVYVRSDGSDADGCGTTTAGACASIQKGIGSCGASGCGVLVRHGAYDLKASLVLQNGVNVYGGCLFAGETDRSYRSFINGPAGAPAVSAASITTPTVFQHFVVRAGNASQTGGSSVAMAVSGSGGLSLKEVRLVAGRGEQGARGADAGAAGAGESGDSTYGTGGRACPASYAGTAGAGGSGGFNQINGVSGCFIDCNCTHTLTPAATGGASPGGAPGGANGVNAGGAGCACAGRSNDTPGNGDAGQNGSAGACSQQPGAAAGNLAGSLDAAGGWNAGSGGAGSAGDIGAGGGGGHGGGIAVNFTFGSAVGTAYSGGRGRGGAGGGCGGPPGPARPGTLAHPARDPPHRARGAPGVRHRGRGGAAQRRPDAPAWLEKELDRSNSSRSP